MPVAIPVQRRIRIRFFLCSWLFVLSAFSFIDRTSVSIAGPALIAQFGIGDQQLGWIASAFLVGYASFQLPAGVLAVRLGPRRVIAFGVLVWAICNICTALLPAGFPSAVLLLIAVRCALGVAEAVIYPSANQFVAHWVPQKERGFVNGLIFAGVGAGSGLTPPLLTWIILRFNWRAAFWFDAALGLTGAAIWWTIARDRPEHHPAVTAAERDEIAAGLTSFSAPPSQRLLKRISNKAEDRIEDRRISWRAIFSRIDLVALMLSYFAYGYTSWIFFSWFYLYMAQARGLDLHTSALFTMLPFLCMTVFCLAGGFVSDRLTRAVGLRAGRCWLAFAAMLATGVFLLAGSRVHAAFTAAVLLALGAGCLYFSQSSFWSVSTELAGNNSGVFSALVNMSCQIGAALTASFTPWLALHFNWKMPFTVAAAFVFVGALSWMLVHPERPLEI